MLFLSSADVFTKLTFSKNSLRNTIRVSNGLNPDRDQHSGVCDMGSNCLHRLSADKKITTSKERVKYIHFAKQRIMS